MEEETENWRGKNNCPGAPAGIGTHIPGGEGLPLTFPTGAGVGGLACPGPPGLALSPRPPPSPWRAAAAAGRRATLVQARRVWQRGNSPWPGPPRKPFPDQAVNMGGGCRRDVTHPPRTGSGSGSGQAWPAPASHPAGGGGRQEVVGGPGQRCWHARVHAGGIPN